MRQTAEIYLYRESITAQIANNKTRNKSLKNRNDADKLVFIFYIHACI